MSDKDRDQIIWNTIFSFYEDKNKEWPLEQTRQENQEKAYWCREAGDNQKLFINKAEQRLMARLIKSFLNTSYKGGFRKKINSENWFDESEIIDYLQKKTDKITDKKLKDFVTDACALLTGTTHLKNYELNQEQTSNLDALHKFVNQEFDSRLKNGELKVSDFEKKFLDHITKKRNNRIDDRIPVDLIFKMQKVISGFGIALTCDFLKESHLCNIAKPDVHLRHVFSMIDGIPYSEDLILVKRISEFAEHVGKKPDPDDFCNSGPYYIDKIIWMLCSSHKLGHKNKCSIPSFKDELLKIIAAKVQEID